MASNGNENSGDLLQELSGIKKMVESLRKKQEDYRYESNYEQESIHNLQFIDNQEKKTSIATDLRNKEHRITLGFSSLDAPCTHAYS